MAELNELRIRLEGALELVESATAGMCVATEALQQGIASEVVAAMTESASEETKQALAALEHLSQQEPSLVPVLQKFNAAREALRARVLLRGAELGLTSMSVESVVAVLARYPVLYEGVAVRWRPFALGAMPILLSVALGWLNPILFIVPTVAALIVLTIIVSALRLVVTQGHVRVGGTVIAVADMESLLIAGTLDAPREILRFRLRGGSSIEVGLNQLPPDFISALERVVKVERQ